MIMYVCIMYICNYVCMNVSIYVVRTYVCMYGMYVCMYVCPVSNYGVQSLR